jgi:hypothetical protein
LGGSFHPGSAWTTSSFAAGTNAGTSLTATSAGAGIGVYTAANGNEVGYTVWSGAAWSAPAPISSAAVAMGQPFIDAANGATAHLAFQDSTYHFNYLHYAAGTWTTPAQPIGTSADPFYGPVQATIAARGTDATVAFIDGEASDGSVAHAQNHVGQADLTAGAWQPLADVGGFANFHSGFSPVIIPLNAGPELMIVYVECDNIGCDNGSTTTQIAFMTRSGGTWSSPAPITNCTTNDRPAVAPLPNGGAILAFRGTDTPTTGYLYWSVYSAGTWSAVAPFATPNEAIAGPPAVTHGVGGATAEIAFIDTSGKAYHARLTGSTWSAPVLVGGASLNGVAIASMP